MGLVVLLETQSLSSSKWTMWEAAFAHRYRVGPIAVNFNGATGLRATTVRHSVYEDPANPMAPQAVDGIVKLILDEHLKVAAGRRAYYETLIRLAAQSKGGDVTAIGSDVLQIADKQSAVKGFALPSGVPSQLRHVQRLVETTTGGSALLAGEYQHLPPADRSDLEWLAAKENVKLTGVV